MLFRSNREKRDEEDEMEDPEVHTPAPKRNTQGQNLKITSSLGRSVAMAHPPRRKGDYDEGEYEEEDEEEIEEEFEEVNPEVRFTNLKHAASLGRGTSKFRHSNTWRNHDKRDPEVQTQTPERRVLYTNLKTTPSLGRGSPISHSPHGRGGQEEGKGADGRYWRGMRKAFRGRAKH